MVIELNVLCALALFLCRCGLINLWTIAFMSKRIRQTQISLKGNILKLNHDFHEVLLLLPKRSGQPGGFKRQSQD